MFLLFSCFVILLLCSIRFSLRRCFANVVSLKLSSRVVLGLKCSWLCGAVVSKGYVVVKVLFSVVLQELCSEVTLARDVGDIEEGVHLPRDAEESCCDMNVTPRWVVTSLKVVAFAHLQKVVT